MSGDQQEAFSKRMRKMRLLQCGQRLPVVADEQHSLFTGSITFSNKRFSKVTLSPIFSLNNIVFSGLINGDREIVVRYHFDKISVKLPTFLTLSTKRSWQLQVHAKPITTMATYGSSVFKLRSVQSGDYRVSVESTQNAFQFFQFQVNPLERTHLKIDIKALYDKK